MKEISVKVSYEWKNIIPVIRQTSNYSSRWENCKFYFNNELKKYDYWIVYGDLLRTETAICPKENIILISNEPPSLIQYSSKFTDQFSTIISSHRDIEHKNNILYQQGYPWLIEKNYDELLFIKEQQKTKLATIIISDKSFTPEYKKRYDFIQKLKNHFGNKIDFFISEFFNQNFQKINKWSTLTPYKYQIVIENSQHNDYWTEKLTDSFLSLCYPIYYGAPNINRYFSSKTLSTIDINHPTKAIKTVERIISSNYYEKYLVNLKKAKEKCLNKYNFFALIANFIKQRETKKSEKYIYCKNVIKKTTHHGIMLFFPYHNEKQTEKILARKKKILVQLAAQKINIAPLIEKYQDNCYYNLDKNRLNEQFFKNEKKIIDSLLKENPNLDKKIVMEIFCREIIYNAHLKDIVSFLKNCEIPKKEILKIFYRIIIKKIKKNFKKLRRVY